MGTFWFLLTLLEGNLITAVFLNVTFWPQRREACFMACTLALKRATEQRNYRIIQPTLRRAVPVSLAAEHSEHWTDGNLK